MQDKIKIKGIIELEIIDSKTKQIIETKVFTNLITNDGLKMHRNWAAGIPPLTDPDFNVDTRITHMALGDGNSAPAASQTALDNELIRKELYPSPDPNCEIDFTAVNEVRYIMLLDETELNGETIRELALFSTTFTDFMVTRFLTGELLKSSAVQFRFKYKIVYS